MAEESHALVRRPCVRSGPRAKLTVGGPAALAKHLEEAFLLQCQKKVTHRKSLLRPFVPSVSTRGQYNPGYGEEDAGSSFTAEALGVGVGCLRDLGNNS